MTVENLLGRKKVYYLDIEFFEVGMTPVKCDNNQLGSSVESSDSNVWLAALAPPVWLPLLCPDRRIQAWGLSRAPLASHRTASEGIPGVRDRMTFSLKCVSGHSWRFIPGTQTPMGFGMSGSPG